MKKTETQTKLNENDLYELVTVTFQLTTQLRWNDNVLEQAWQCLETGELNWDQVPHAEDSDLP